MSEEELDIEVEGTDGDDDNEGKTVIELALDRFKDIENNFQQIRTEGVEDLKFAFEADGQWAEALVTERENTERSWFTINKLPTLIYRTTNDMRKSLPGIKIRPSDNNTDPITADVIDGLCRAIMNNSDSGSAINNATFYQVVCGIGFFKVSTDYINPESMDQEIKLDMIENPFSVYFPMHLIKKADYSDAPYAFIRYKMSKEDFKLKYPDADEKNFDKFMLGDDDWKDEDSVTLAEYWSVDEEEKTLYQFSDGSCKILDDEPDSSKQPIGVFLVNKRKTFQKKITRRVITQYDVLEENDWDGQYIPIVPLTGQLVVIDGKKHYISLVRFAKDPQKMYNYWHTAFTELVSLQPKSPWMMPAESRVEDFPEWKTANTQPHAYLRYHTMDEMGNQLPTPVRNSPPEIGQSIVLGMQIATDNIKEVTGLSEAALGQQGNEVSGLAIQERNREGENAIFHFVDNQATSMKFLGKILVDLIPHIYDVPRAIRILGADMTDEIVQVNHEHKDLNDNTVLYDLTVGQYDVFCDVGPSYETKRIETATNMLKLVNSVPEFGAATGDLLISLLDFPQADKVAARYRNYMALKMPGLITPDDTGMRASPEQLKASLTQMQGIKQQDEQQKAQMQQVIQQLQTQLTQMKAAEIDRTQEHQLKLQTAQMDSQAEIQKAQLGVQQAKIKTDAAMAKHVMDTGMQLHQMHQASIADQANNPPSNLPEGINPQNVYNGGF